MQIVDRWGIIQDIENPEEEKIPRKGAVLSESKI